MSVKDEYGCSLLGDTRPDFCAGSSPLAHLDAAALNHVLGEPHPRFTRRSPSLHPAWAAARNAGPTPTVRLFQRRLPWSTKRNAVPPKGSVSYDHALQKVVKDRSTQRRQQRRLSCVNGKKHARVLAKHRSQYRGYVRPKTAKLSIKNLKFLYSSIFFREASKENESLPTKSGLQNNLNTIAFSLPSHFLNLLEVCFLDAEHFPQRIFLKPSSRH